MLMTDYIRISQPVFVRTGHVLLTLTCRLHDSIRIDVVIFTRSTEDTSFFYEALHLYCNVVSSKFYEIEEIECK